MSHYKKFTTNSYCVGGKHYSGTKNIYGDVTQTGRKLLRGSCTTCGRNKSMTVSDATIEGEGLKDFFKSVGKAAVGFGKKVANNPVRALEIASNIGQAAVTRDPKAALKVTPDLIKFATTGKGLTIIDNKTGKKTVVKGSGLYLTPWPNKR